MRLAAAILLFALLASGAVCLADTAVSGDIRARVAADFDQVVKARRQALSGGSGKEVSVQVYTKEADRLDLRTADSQLLPLILKDAGYRTAVVSELASADADRRGLACEILRTVFDLSVLRELGALLDDRASCISGRMGLRQTGPQYITISKSTVGDAARFAVNCMTDIGFTSKAEFDTWWKANQRYDDKLWYWSAKWYWSAVNERETVAGWKSYQSTVIADIKDSLSSLPPETALKIILLARNRGAVANELARVLGDSSQATVDAGHGSDQWAGPGQEQAMADFILKNNLKNRVLALLQQKDLYWEAASDSAFGGLVWDVRFLLGSKVFSAEDEPAIAQAQEITKPYVPPISDLVLLRAEIASKRAHAILREALSRRPGLADVAVRLVMILQPEDAVILAKSFQSVSPWDRQMIAQRVKDSVGKATGINSALIHRLVQALPEPPATELRSDLFESCIALCSLADASNAIAGSSVIPNDLINAARPLMLFKSTLTDEQKAHNASLYDAFRALKSAVLASGR